MESLQDLLGKYSRKEPPEIQIIKNYIAEQFKAAASVALQGDKAIVVTVSSASLANTLRFHVPKLQAACETDKRILLRIG